MGMRGRKNRRAATTGRQRSYLQWRATAQALESRVMLDALLEVPYSNQDGTQWCWATSISMVLEYYGYDRKPWQVAADFDKGTNELLGEPELPALESYLETYYDGGASDAWHRDDFTSGLLLKQRLQNVLDSGDPIWIASDAAAHVVVVTGYIGNSVFVNDPSGALDDPDDVTNVVHHEYTWGRFLDLMEINWSISLYGVHEIHANDGALNDQVSTASLQVQPHNLWFDNSVGGVQRRLDFTWDGVEPFDGYRYQPSISGWYTADGDGAYASYGYNATQADTLHLAASYSNYALPGQTVFAQTRAEIHRASDGALIRTITSGVDSIGQFKWLSDSNNNDIACALSSFDPGAYRMDVKLEGGSSSDPSTFTVQDQSSFFFGITAYTAPDTIPPTASLYFPTNNGSVMLSSLNSDPKVIEVTFDDTDSGVNASSITDAAAEFSLSGSGVGTASLTGATPTLKNGLTKTYKFPFSGSFKTGNVTLSFPAGAFADNAIPANSSGAFTQTFTVIADPVGGTVGMPTISPAGGTFSSPVQVTLSSTPGASIRYTLDGSDPTASSPLYSAPFTLTTSTTVKARGFAAGMSSSAVAAEVFAITTFSTPVIELITNGGFESGITGWQVQGPIVAANGFQHTGTMYAVMGEIDSTTDIMYQTVTIPPDATAATFSYWYNIYSEEGTTTAYDVLSTTIRDGSGNLLYVVDSKSNVNKDSGVGAAYYHKKTFNLLPYKGQTIRVQFLVTMDPTVFSSFKIDDVSVAITVPKTIYVDANAPASNGDGTSWSTAFRDLQAAIFAAATGDEIRVADGTYKPTSSTDRSIAFPLKSSVGIFGGFAGYGAADPNTRDVAAYTSVLSGDIGVNGHGPDNSYRVINATNVNAAAQLDGFTVTGGNAFDVVGFGGGAMRLETSSPTIRNCIFSQNASYWGGGVFCYASNATFTNCTFSNNTANNVGGGFWNVSASPTLSDCSFSGNSSGAGGAGMYNQQNSSPTLNGCTFSNNVASGGGGGIYNYFSSSPTLTGCAFTANSSLAGGGAMFNNSNANASVSGCTFTRNTSNSAGAVYNLSSTPTFTSCAFSGNTASNFGGAMQNVSSSPAINNCVFSGNAAVSQSGGGIYNTASSSPSLINCTLASNSAGQLCGGIYNSSATTTLTNCIVWGNTAITSEQITDGTAVVSYCDIQGGYVGTNNFDLNPDFIHDPARGSDNTWGTVDDYYGDLRVRNTSPVIDAGNNAVIPGSLTTDIAENHRIVDYPGIHDPGAIVDIGAYETVVVIDNTVPTITNVASNTADGLYKAGSLVAITVSFSEIVYVFGNPVINLNSGGNASYASGSATNSLTFNYVIGAGQNSSDLDYASNSALGLNGGIIYDAGVNNATLTLPPPGGTGSLAANKNIVIDTLAPTISSVTSSASNSSYNSGNVIPILVNFSENVTVSGAPQLALNTGAVASYASGGGTSVLTFNYLVVAGQNTADLDYSSSSALSLNGGSIRDAVTNDANLTLPAPAASGSLGSNKDIVIDTTQDFSAVPSGTPDLLIGTDSGISNTDNRTNFNNSSAAKALQFSITGTLPGSTLKLYANNTLIQTMAVVSTTTIVTSNGSVTLPFVSGGYAITATQTETNKLESPKSPALTVTIDSGGPATPATVTATPTSNAIFIDWNSSTAPDLWGYNIYRSGTSGGPYTKLNSAPLASSDYTDTSLGAQTYYYRAGGVDTAGNESNPLSAEVAALSPVTQSAMPGVPDLLPLFDTGTSSTDDVTNRNNSSMGGALSFTVGPTVTGATINLFADGNLVGQAVAAGTSVIVTTNVAALADGSHTFTAKQTEIGKLESTMTAALLVSVDSTVPILANPGDQSFEAIDSAGSPITYLPATATDAFDPTPIVMHTSANGSTFAIGATDVMATATDIAGNSAITSFKVTVVDPSWLHRENGGAYHFTNAGQTLHVTGGHVVLTANGGVARPGLILAADGGTTSFAATQTVAAITFSGGTVDLTSHSMIITGMSRSDVEPLVKSGFGNFDWLGTGITSSIAATFAQTDGSRAVGVIDNADWGYGTFSGETVSSTDILVKFTYTADSNLDGLIDNDDFGQFLYGFNGGGAPCWLNGDFDLNGVVDNDDFGWFLTRLGAFNASGGVQL